MDPRSLTKAEDAVRAFFEARDFFQEGMAREDWYKDNWVRYAIGGRMIPILPIYGFKKTFILHDIHHVFAGYDTTVKGELEIAAWELASGGCRWFLLYWLDRLVLCGLGLLFYPRATSEAFRRGRAHQNLFHLDPDAVLDSDCATIREIIFERTRVDLQKEA